MQTPKPNSTKITGLIQKNKKEIQLSPYRTKIKSIQSSIHSIIQKYQIKLNMYKWCSKLSITSSLLFSSILLSLSFLPTTNQTKLFKGLSIANLGCIFSYQIIQPSSKYIIYKEVIDGLQSLHQSIDFYLCKYNEDDYQNYITFESCLHKLLKKLEIF